jgi:hypothetical protein
VTPEREVVWQYDAPEAADIHTGQPIRLDKVMIVRNGLPPKLTIIEKNLELWKCARAAGRERGPSQEAASANPAWAGDSARHGVRHGLPSYLNVPDPDAVVAGPAEERQHVDHR